MLRQNEEKQILTELGVISSDTRSAEFYYHKVFDNDASTGKARELAVVQALEKERLINKHRNPDEKHIEDPDFSRENLKRLGAEPIYKDVLYIKIGHWGSKDNKSRIATEQDKITFSEQWKQFNEKEKSNQEKSRPETNYTGGQRPSNIGNIHQGWQTVQPNAVRPEHQAQGFGQVEFNYTIEM